MKRYPPEDRAPRESYPLFPDAEPARARGHAAADAAASRAGRLDPSWKAQALAAVMDHARRHSAFLSEQVGFVMPAGADRRALGHVMKEAERLGYVRADGYAPAVTSNGTPKTLWRSLIYQGAAAS